MKRGVGDRSGRGHRRWIFPFLEGLQTGVRFEKFFRSSSLQGLCSSGHCPQNSSNKDEGERYLIWKERDFMPIGQVIRFIPSVFLPACTISINIDKDIDSHASLHRSPYLREDF